MRLIEEKNLMKMNIISMVFIVLTSVFIQIADHYIGERKDVAMMQVLLLLQKEQFKVNHDTKARFYTIYRALGIEAHNIMNEGEYNSSDDYDSLNMDKERIDLRRQFKNGTISSQEYTSKLIDYHQKRSEKFRRDYNEIWRNIQKTHPSNWEIIKKLSFVLQIIGVFILIFGYSNLLLLIQKRTYSGKS
jgi:preprotein translocase subunit SecE